MLAQLALVISVTGLVLPQPAAQVVVQQVAPAPPTSTAVIFPQSDAVGLAISTLVADDFTEEERDAARLKGVGVLAFGLLPSLWAAAIGVPGAFGKKTDKQ